MNGSDCAVIILASGLSQRFGDKNKLKANLHGKPLVAHIAQTLSCINFSNHYAVIAQGADDLEVLLRRTGFTIIHNPTPEAGQASSLAIGAKGAMTNGHKSVCICLADMPFVSARHIMMLLGTRGDVVMSTYKGNQMPPAIFRGQAFQKLIHIRGDKGKKSIIANAKAAQVPLSKLASRDIDTVNDLIELQTLHQY